MTGGAGFIGSHVVDRLLQIRSEVVVYDNFSTGKELFIEHHRGNPMLHVCTADVLDFETLKREMKGCDVAFHFQANADVRNGMKNTRIDLDQNTLATWNVLEAMRHTGVKTIIFASSATVYGEPLMFPTPEDYCPVQTSLYGASKYACEGMIQAFAGYFGMRYLIFRFVSWIGKRYHHGVICDFFRKLRADPGRLEILGDGKQEKSYLDVDDGVEGVFTVFAAPAQPSGIFNLGHTQTLTVSEVAKIIIHELNLQNVQFKTTGGVRGWIGDSPIVRLDISKVQSLGWTPRVSIEEGIRQTVTYLQGHMKPGVVE